MLNDRFDFDKLFNQADDLPAELLRRCFDLQLRITKLGIDTVCTFKLEGNLALERPETDPDDEDAEIPAEEIDLTLLHRLLARFEKAEA